MLANLDPVKLARLRFIREQSRAIEKARVTRLHEAALDQPHRMVLMLAKVKGIGIETADMLVNELLCQNSEIAGPLRDMPG